MIVSAATIPEFGPDQSKTIIGGLSRLYSELNDLHPPGFVRALLLREDQGQALLLTMWESRKDLGDFMSSDTGKKLGAEFGKLIGGAATDMRDYYVTWQADADEPRPCECGAHYGRY